MSYMNIDNLYKNQDILLFKKCYALEKIDGTSAHISWREEQLSFFVGGIKQEVFEALFDKAIMLERFKALGLPAITVFGEAYGGKIQGRREVYGPDIKFVAFEVKIGECWLAVPDAENVCRSLGTEFVFYEEISTDIKDIDAARGQPSQQAFRNGMGTDKMREGIVLRPLVEVRKNNGARIIAKHKNEECRETKTSRKLSAEGMKIISDANAIAEEWVTENRLSHVLDKFPDAGITKTGAIISAMIEDIVREGVGEIVDSREARVAISRVTALMFKRRLQSVLYHKQL